MGLTKSLLLGAVATACAVQAVRAEPSAELLDLAARVHYGYYHGEPRAIEAAQAALDRLRRFARGALLPRLRGAAPRAARRRGPRGPAALGRVRASATSRPVSTKRFAAEAWVLVAACALLAGDERPPRRGAGARARARRRQPAHRARRSVGARARGRHATRRSAKPSLAKLTAVVEAFDAWTPSIDDPDWGHAEALTALAANALERGQVRTARDLIERALLLVPDYRAAVELRVAMQSARNGDRDLVARRANAVAFCAALVFDTRCDGAARTLSNRATDSSPADARSAPLSVRESRRARYLTLAAAAAAHARARRAARHARGRGRRIRARASAMDRGRAARARRAPPAALRRAADRRSSCARSARRWRVEYRHDPRGAGALPRPASRCSRCRRANRIAAAPTRRCGAGCSTRPTITWRPGCCASRKWWAGGRRTCRFACSARAGGVARIAAPSA